MPRKSENTKGEFSREATQEEVDRCVEKLSKATSLGQERVCYLFGMGGQPEETYRILSKRSELKMVFSRSILPWYLRFLNVIAGTYSGLARVEDVSILPFAFKKVTHLSMAGIYFVDARYEQELARQARNLDLALDLGIKVDPAYSYYVVDADNHEVRSGIVEIISYGISTPEDLVPMV